MSAAGQQSSSRRYAPPGGINLKQIRLIHTLKNALGLTDEEYRLRIIEKHGFSGTSKDLSFEEAAQLIKAWEREAIEKGVWKRYATRGDSPDSTTPGGVRKSGTVPLKYDALGERKGMASPKQLRKIEAMWKDASYTHDAAKRQLALRHFIFRITGVSEMRFLESGHAHKVIEAITAMKRKHGPSHGTRVYKDCSNAF